jgi:hypothetical protein
MKNFLRFTKVSCLTFGEIKKDRSLCPHGMDFSLYTKLIR